MVGITSVWGPQRVNKNHVISHWWLWWRQRDWQVSKYRSEPEPQGKWGTGWLAPSMGRWRMKTMYLCGKPEEKPLLMFFPWPNSYTREHYIEAPNSSTSPSSDSLWRNICWCEPVSSRIRGWGWIKWSISFQLQLLGWCIRETIWDTPMPAEERFSVMLLWDKTMN